MTDEEKIEERIEAQEAKIDNLIDFINKIVNRAEQENKDPNYPTIGNAARSIGVASRERDILVNIKASIDSNHG